MIVGTILQQPSEFLDYDIHYDEFLETSNDVISPEPGEAPTVTSTPSGPSVIVERSSDTVAKVWVSGGLAGVEYKLTVKMRTSGGRVKEDELILVVQEF